MKRLLVTGSILTALCSSSFAADFLPKDGGNALVSAASSWGAELQAKEENCEQGKTLYTCRYAVTGGVTFIAAAPSKDEAVKAIGLYFTSESDPSHFFVAAGAMMGILDPEITQEERKRIVKKLVEGATKGGAAELGDSYTVTSEYDRSIGVRILADIQN